MPTCYFCDKNDRSYFSYYCDDCALLRRLLIVYEPTKAIEILKRTLIRDQSQINNKIENIVKENLPVIKETNDDTDEEPEVENKKKIIKTFIP